MFADKDITDRNDRNDGTNYIKGKKEGKEEFVQKIFEMENNIKQLQTNYEFKVENYESLMNVYNAKVKVIIHVLNKRN